MDELMKIVAANNSDQLQLLQMIFSQDGIAEALEILLHNIEMKLRLANDERNMRRFHETEDRLEECLRLLTEKNMIIQRLEESRGIFDKTEMSSRSRHVDSDRMMEAKLKEAEKRLELMALQIKDKEILDSVKVRKPSNHSNKEWERKQRNWTILQEANQRLHGRNSDILCPLMYDDDDDDEQRPESDNSELENRFSALSASLKDKDDLLKKSQISLKESEDKLKLMENQLKDKSILSPGKDQLSELLKKTEARLKDAEDRLVLMSIQLKDKEMIDNVKVQKEISNEKSRERKQKNWEILKETQERLTGRSTDMLCPLMDDDNDTDDSEEMDIPQDIDDNNTDNNNSHHHLIELKTSLKENENVIKIQQEHLEEAQNLLIASEIRLKETENRLKEYESNLQDSDDLREATENLLEETQNQLVATVKQLKTKERHLSEAEDQVAAMVLLLKSKEKHLKDAEDRLMTIQMKPITITSTTLKNDENSDDSTHDNNGTIKEKSRSTKQQNWQLLKDTEKRLNGKGSDLLCPYVEEDDSDDSNDNDNDINDDSNNNKTEDTRVSNKLQSSSNNKEGSIIDVLENRLAVLGMQIIEKEDNLKSIQESNAKLLQEKEVQLQQLYTQLLNVEEKSKESEKQVHETVMKEIFEKNKYIEQMENSLVEAQSRLHIMKIQLEEMRNTNTTTTSTSNSSNATTAISSRNESMKDNKQKNWTLLKETGERLKGGKLADMLCPLDDNDTDIGNGNGRKEIDKINGFTTATSPSDSLDGSLAMMSIDLKYKEQLIKELERRLKQSESRLAETLLSLSVAESANKEEQNPFLPDVKTHSQLQSQMKEYERIIIEKDKLLESNVIRLNEMEKQLKDKTNTITNTNNDAQKDKKSNQSWQNKQKNWELIKETNERIRGRVSGLLCPLMEDDSCDIMYASTISLDNSNNNNNNDNNLAIMAIEIKGTEILLKEKERLLKEKDLSLQQTDSYLKETENRLEVMALKLQEKEQELKYAYSELITFETRLQEAENKNPLNDNCNDDDKEKRNLYDRKEKQLEIIKRWQRNWEYIKSNEDQLQQHTTASMNGLTENDTLIYRLATTASLLQDKERLLNEALDRLVEYDAKLKENESQLILNKNNLHEVETAFIDCENRLGDMENVFMKLFHEMNDHDSLTVTTAAVGMEKFHYLLNKVNHNGSNISSKNKNTISNTIDENNDNNDNDDNMRSNELTHDIIYLENNTDPNFQSSNPLTSSEIHPSFDVQAQFRDHQHRLVSMTNQLECFMDLVKNKTEKKYTTNNDRLQLEEDLASARSGLTSLVKDEHSGSGISSSGIVDELGHGTLAVTDRMNNNSNSNDDAVTTSRLHSTITSTTTLPPNEQSLQQLPLSNMALDMRKRLYDAESKIIEQDAEINVLRRKLTDTNWTVPVPVPVTLTGPLTSGVQLHDLKYQLSGALEALEHMKQHMGNDKDFIEDKLAVQGVDEMDKSPERTQARKEERTLINRAFIPRPLDII